MKRSRLLAILITAGLGLSIWAAATAQESPRQRPDVAVPARPAAPAVNAATKAAPSPNGVPDFNGRFVVVSTKEGSQPRVLAKVHFQEIYGRRFLIGEEVRSAFSVPLGAPIHIAWDAVAAFYVFDSLAQYEQAMRQAMEQAQGALGQMFEGFLPGASPTIRIGPGSSNGYAEPVFEPNPQMSAPQMMAPAPAANQPTFYEPTPTEAPPKRIVSQPSPRSTN